MTLTREKKDEIQAFLRRTGLNSIKLLELMDGQRMSDTMASLMFAMVAMAETNGMTKDAVLNLFELTYKCWTEIQNLEEE